MCLPERRIKTICKHRKLPISTLEKALSMTKKSREIHKIWLVVLTAYHRRRPLNWSCAVSQRWVMLYWNAKWLLREQSWCCFKMHEKCMEQRKWWIEPCFFFIFYLGVSLYSLSHTTQAPDFVKLVPIKVIKCYSYFRWVRHAYIKTTSGYYLFFVLFFVEHDKWRYATESTQQLSCPLNTNQQRDSLFVWHIHCWGFWKWANRQIIM